MKYSTVLFDLDGTLTDPVQGICGSVRYALQKAGRPVGPIESYHKYIGPPLLRSFEVYANATPEEAQELLGYYRERFSTVGLFENVVYPGIPELLSYLQSAGIQSAVASNKYQAATEKLVAHYFPGIHFTAVFGQREGVNVKPDPTIVFDILKLTDVRKEDVLYVGDSGVDMQTAANAGVTACGVTWGFRPRTELEEFAPPYITETAEEIKRLISADKI